MNQYFKTFYEDLLFDTYSLFLKQQINELFFFNFTSHVSLTVLLRERI